MISDSLGNMVDCSASARTFAGLNVGGSSAYPDGSSAAPAGVIPQYPNILSGYAARPPWKVAGVDYGVGPAAAYGTTIPWKVPGVNAMPAGASYSGSTIRLSGSCTLDGWDFSVNGGVNIYADLQSGGPYTINISNCRFAGPNIQGPAVSTGTIDIRGTGHTVVVKYCSFDGANPLNGNWNASCFIALSAYNNQPKLTVQYNVFRNWAQRVVELNDAASLDYQFNLMAGFDNAVGGHNNLLQWGAGTAYSPVFAYNTNYTDPSMPGWYGAEGPQFYFNFGGTMINPTCSNNVFIATGLKGGQPIMSYFVHGSAEQTSGQGIGQNNYFDTRGAYGAWYGGSVNPWTISGNINMNTGGAQNS